MFRVSASRDVAAAQDFATPRWDEAEIALLSRFCAVDRWSANLHNAMLSLGPDACRFHGLGNETGRFGLLEFVRCYDPRVCHEIIGVFEDAAARARPFQYTAQLRSSGEASRVVHCFGDYRQVGPNDGDDELYGLFLFSRREFETV
ncbi:MAG: hypothetical protein ACTHJ3_09945 [Pararhizobium sp.]